jgi:hypothetical protein
LIGFPSTGLVMLVFKDGILPTLPPAQFAARSCAQFPLAKCGFGGSMIRTFWIFSRHTEKGHLIYCV